MLRTCLQPDCSSSSLMWLNSLNTTMPCLRFLILFFNCLLTFGSYFCYDLPSALQYWLQGNVTMCDLAIDNATVDRTCDSLGMTPQQYSLLYAVCTWTDAVVVLWAGVLVDKLGSRVCVVLFSFLCVLGSSLFAMGMFFTGSAAMFPIMLVGRLVFGSGNSSLTIVQSRLLFFWFRDSELLMALGATVATSRLGSVLNFAVSATIARKFGVMWALWTGAFLCVAGFLAGNVLGLLDRSGFVQQGREARVWQETREWKFTDVRLLSRQYWLLVLATTFFYSSVYPFVAESSKFVRDKYGYSPEEASYLTGAIYSVAIFSPFVGCAVDFFGKRGHLAFVSGLLTVPVFALLAFTDVHPLVSTLWLGMTFVMTTASLFHSVPLLVPQAALGMAIGVGCSVQMVGVGISNVVVGAILGNQTEEGSDRGGDWLVRWKYVMMFLVCNVVMSVFMTALLNLTDMRRERVLNQSHRERVSRLLIEEHLQHSDSGCYNDCHEPSEHDPLLFSRPYYSADIN